MGSQVAFLGCFPGWSHLMIDWAPKKCNYLADHKINIKKIHLSYIMRKPVFWVSDTTVQPYEDDGSQLEA